MTRPTGAELAAMSESEFAAFIRETGIGTVTTLAPLWGSLRKPDEPPAPTTEEWVERIARGSTPVREYEDGRFQAWIRPSDPQKRGAA